MPLNKIIVAVNKNNILDRFFRNNDYSKREFLEEICFKKISSFSDPEYFEIRQSNDLRNTGSSDQKWRAFTATKFGSVRLIDNIALN